MKIANPIYDVAFKFMMEDNEVAKTFLSAIIQEEVVELDFAPQERTFRVSSQTKSKRKKEPESSGINYTVCRFDFSARIATSGGGYKTVLIELQKAELASDIMRFRRYLGLHYQNPANVYGGKNNQKARRIYCIFLLGYDIGVPGRPVIQVDSHAKDVVTGKDVEISSNEFIKSLHHHSWIVQTGQLKPPHRNDLEKLLSIFDQANRSMNYHFVNVNEEEFPEKYRSIIRRLRMAAESEDVQIEMEMEDDYMKELQDKEREIAEEKKINREQRKINREQKKALKEKDKIIEDKDNAMKEQRKAIEEQGKAIEELRKQLSDMQRQKTTR